MSDPQAFLFLSPPGFNDPPARIEPLAVSPHGIDKIVYTTSSNQAASASLLHFLPGLVWVELLHGACKFLRRLPQILFIDDPFVIHDKGHNS